MGGADHHVVTMTGELADTFATRAEGVAAHRGARGARAWRPCRSTPGRAGFVAPDRAGRHVQDIASANWYASAALVARRRASALFMDMGSTTTDIVPVADRRGRGARLHRRGTSRGRRARLYRAHAQLPDGGGATARRSPGAGPPWSTRISPPWRTCIASSACSPRAPTRWRPRTGGRRPPKPRARASPAWSAATPPMPTPQQWTALAHWLAEAQMRAVLDGAMLVLSAGTLPADAPVITAGIGAATLREIARRLGREAVAFEIAARCRARGARTGDAVRAGRRTRDSGERSGLTRHSRRQADAWLAPAGCISSRERCLLQSWPPPR